MKALKRLTCVLLTLSLLFGDGYITSFAGLDFAKPLTVAASTVTDCYDAYDNLVKVISETSDATSQLSLKVNNNTNTRVKTAGNPTSPDMSTLWKLNKDKYSYGVYKGYFTYEQKNIDAAAQVKSGKWLNNTKYEAMTGTPTTERLFFTMGGSQWIVDLQYRMVQAQYLRRYKFSAGAANYCYYKWGPVQGGFSYGDYPEVTTQSWNWDVNPKFITWQNAAFRKYEGYYVDLAHYGDQYQGGRSTQLPGGKFVPTADGFHTSNKIFRYNAPLSTSLTPNQYAAIATKKYLYNAIKSFVDGFNSQTDNYRADQGLSDPVYDDTGAVAYYRQIGWNYTYFFMARKSYNAYHNKTSVVGTIGSGCEKPNYSWTATAWCPCFITYLYDWQSYHESSGLDKSYPSATLANPFVRDIQSLTGFSVASRLMSAFHQGELTSGIGALDAVFPMTLFKCTTLENFGVTASLHDWIGTPISFTYQVIGRQVPYSDFRNWTFFDLDYFSYNAVAYAYESKTYGMKLDKNNVGDAVDTTYKTSMYGLDVDMVNYGYNPMYTIYMYAMYYIFLNFGPLFYADEQAELFKDCPWYKPNTSVWTTLKANQVLGLLFGATTAAEYNANVNTLSLMFIRIPLAVFPRGGDLDGTHRWSESSYGGVIETGAIDNYRATELFGFAMKPLNAYTYSVYINVDIPGLKLYTYGDTFCAVQHGDGVHCLSCSTANLCCKDNHVKHDPPSGTDAHGVGPTSGCIHGTAYSTKSVDIDGCCGTCDACHHECDDPPEDADEDWSCDCPSHSYHDLQDTSSCHILCTHYRGEDAHHDTGWPLQSHVKHSFVEKIDVEVSIPTGSLYGGFTSTPAMSYEATVGQLFTNVQWLDITSYQVWMMNRGQSKGLAKILASPVTVDKDSEILQTAVVDQKGFTVYNIDDPDNKEPSDGLTTITDEKDNLQAKGRVANSFNSNSAGNNELADNYVLEFANEGFDSYMGACTLSYLGNDVPATKGQPLWNQTSSKSKFNTNDNYVNGDVHAFMLTSSGTSANDDLKFYYNPYSQGGRSDTSFNGFVLQALAHTLYYPAEKSDKQTPIDWPRRGGSTYWVSYSNSLRIQGDYLGMDYITKQANNQQTLAGYMYDTWDEKDVGVSCSIPTHGHKFKLVKDSEDNYDKIAKYNVRCTWVPARFSYLMSRGPVEQIFGGNAQETITCTNNCFMIHTFCRGINGSTHSCWDSIDGDVGGAHCVPGSNTDMGNVINAPDPHGMLEDAVKDPVRRGITSITLKYWDNKTPYKHLKASFKNTQTYNHKYMYATVNDPSPYVGYAADAAGGKDGTHDITAKGSGADYQQGYRVSVTNCLFDTQRTMVSDKPYVNENGKEVSFAKFGVKRKVVPAYVNDNKSSRGTAADGANAWSSKYPWLQNLDVNRYLANDRYTTGSAQMEYESIDKHKDSGLNTVYAHTETSDVAGKDKYYYRIPKFGGGYLTADKVIYANAAYRRTQSVGDDNFEGNPNDIVIFNPVSTQSAHLIPISEYLPDASNVGTIKDGNTLKRDYTETYLKSFCTYIKRDSRIAYKYDLDNAGGDPDAEKSVNVGSLFVAHNTTTQEYTTEEYYTVSNVDTSYNESSDYQSTVGEIVHLELNNVSGHNSVTITQTGTYNLQYVGTTTLKTSEMSSIDLYSGDVLTFDTTRKMLYLTMVNKYAVDRKSLILLKNKLAVEDSSEYANRSSLITTCADAYTAAHAGSIPDSERSRFINYVSDVFYAWCDSMGYISSFRTTADEVANALIDESTCEDFGITKSSLRAVANTVITEFNKQINKYLMSEGYTGDITMNRGENGQVNFTDSATLRKGETFVIKIKSSKGFTYGDMGFRLYGDESTTNLPISTQTVITPNGSISNGTLNLYVEAKEDDVALSAIQMFFNNKVVISDISIESVPVPILTAVPENIGVLSMTTIGHYTGNSSWSINSGNVPQAKNTYMCKSGTKSTFERISTNSFILELEAYADAGVTLKPSASGPHTVINSNWKNYVVGWYADGSVVTSASDSCLSDNVTMLTAPSGYKITVGDLAARAIEGTLLIYKTSGTYKLALTTDDTSYDSEGLEYYIKSTFYSTQDIVDFMKFSDEPVETLIKVVQPQHVEFYQSSEIKKYYMSCIYYATNVDAKAYDVKYSASDDHKYTSDSENYYQDVFTTTTTRYFFTEEAYTKIFGSYLSLDDEFTIYWDNYADLVNNETGDDTEGTLSDVKLTHTVLGRGWDNRKDSQKNLDDSPSELKGSTVYSDWSKIKKNDYWANMEDSALSKVTDCTKWIYNKYVIFNVDMYAFSPDKSYVYDDTKGPLEQAGTWDPTTPAFKEDGTANNIVYIPAGSHVQLGYYKARNTSSTRYGTNDDNGRFIDYGYRAFYNADGSVNTPNGKDKYTQDPNGDLYTYHFWVPLSDGESDNTVTVQYVVNGINMVPDYDADANKDRVIDNPSGYPDTNNSLANLKTKPSLSGSSYNVKQSLVKDFTGKDDHLQTDSHSSAFKRGIKDEWGNEVLDASGLQVFNNVLGITNITIKEDEDGRKYFSTSTGKTYRRANNTVNSSTVSVIGSIGNFAIVDVGDPRYQDTFKLSTTADTPENYFMYPVVKAIKQYSNIKGQEGSQDYYMTDYLDARGRYKISDPNIADMSSYSLAKNGGDTYSWNNSEQSGSAAWYMASTAHTFSTETKVPNKHSEIVNDNQSIKVGYEQICTLETIGNYFGSISERSGSNVPVNINGDYGQTKLQIIPMYYAYNTRTGEKVNVDVYMKSGSTYTCINAGSEFANKAAADKAKEQDIADGKLVTEAHYYDGPYYLDNAYNNAYTYGATTNTAGTNGSTYLLDHNMLRYSITAKEAEVTYDVCKQLAQSKNNVAVKNGIKHTILDYYDYSDKTSVGGDALDTTYAYGNAQIMYLREYNRTFVGGTTAALSEKLPSTAFSKAMIRNAGMYAQKWYFGVKLPSSTVFVRHGETLTYHKVTRNGSVYTMTSTDLSAEEGWIIYCRITVFAIGDKYILLSHTKPSLDPDPSDDGTPAIPDYRMTLVTIDLDKQKSTVDLEGRGSH